MDERWAECLRCGKQTKQFKSGLTGRWYCQRCGQCVDMPRVFRIVRGLFAW